MSPLLAHWRYCSLAQSHRCYHINCSVSTVCLVVIIMPCDIMLCYIVLQGGSIVYLALVIIMLCDILLYYIVLQGGSTIYLTLVIIMLRDILLLCYKEVPLYILHLSLSCSVWYLAVSHCVTRRFHCISCTCYYHFCVISCYITLCYKEVPLYILHLTLSCSVISCCITLCYMEVPLYILHLLLSFLCDIMLYYIVLQGGSIVYLALVIIMLCDILLCYIVLQGGSTVYLALAIIISVWYHAILHRVTWRFHYISCTCYYHALCDIMLYYIVLQGGATVYLALVIIMLCVISCYITSCYKEVLLHILHLSLSCSVLEVPKNVCSECLGGTRGPSQ